MLYRLLTAGAAVCALTLLGFTGQADATARLMLNGLAKPSPSSPQTRRTPKCRICSTLRPTNGVPGGPTAATPGDEPKAGGEMQAKPEGGGRRDERD